MGDENMKGMRNVGESINVKKKKKNFICLVFKKLKKWEKILII